MFSFSLRWLWAQILAVAVGFYLLGCIALPSPDSQSMVAGRITAVDVIHRKGLGSYYELFLQAEGGEQDRLLLRRNVADEPIVRGLIGHTISAHVNWSSDATDIEVKDYSGIDVARVRQAAEGAKKNYDLLAIIFAGVGMVLGLWTFAFLAKGNGFSDARGN